MQEILAEQAKYPLVRCLEALKSGRPARVKRLIDELIECTKEELPEQGGSYRDLTAFRTPGRPRAGQ
jgi:hypothetical protein